MFIVDFLKVLHCMESQLLKKKRCNATSHNPQAKCRKMLRVMETKQGAVEIFACFFFFLGVGKVKVVTDFLGERRRVRCIVLGMVFRTIICVP